MASSDESIETNATVTSNKSVQKFQPKPKKWEADLVGDFLLQLYHRKMLVDDKDNRKFKLIRKYVVIKEFQTNFLNDEMRQKLKVSLNHDKIGPLLKRNDYLLKARSNNSFYVINRSRVLQYHLEKLNALDVATIRCRTTTKLSNQNIAPTSDTQRFNSNKGAAAAAPAAPAGAAIANAFAASVTPDVAATMCNEQLGLDVASPIYHLQYQCTAHYKSNPTFLLTNTSCYVCQLNFDNMNDFDDHITRHKTIDESSQFFIRSAPIFLLSYRLCKKSNKIYFIIRKATKRNGVLVNPEMLKVERLVVIYSRHMISMNVEQPSLDYSNTQDGVDTALCGVCCLDSYIFTSYEEHPVIVVAYHNKEIETEFGIEQHNIRVVEQHTLLHGDTLPVTQFSYQSARLPKYLTFKTNFRLAKYDPPQHIVKAIVTDFFHEDLKKISKEFRDYLRNNKTLTLSTYVPCLRLLLQIEDIDTINGYKKLYQHSVEINSFGDEYSFQMNVARGIFLENILSLHDYVYLKPVHSPLEQSKTCFITNIHFNRVGIKCERGPIYLYDANGKKIKYTAAFYPGRIGLRYQYRALDLLDAYMPTLNKFLFPTNVPQQQPAKLSLKLLNEDVYTNPEQLEAVCNIVQGPRNEAPYVIFGPPGTGKTTTVVEAILQLLLTNSKSKILVTAPTNSACDEVALRLCKYLKTLQIKRAITRVYARCNEDRAEQLDDILLECSNIYDAHFLPSVDVLHEYRVVVCTLTMVAKLSTGGFGTVFTHVFIDEVAACTEAEALLGIVGILKDSSNLIISGDHKQLGAILRSTKAEDLGLNVSLMERLMNRECYRVDTDTGKFDRSIQTRLRLNFRSHPEIVNVFSELFYNHSLEARATRDEHNLMEKWYKFPFSNFPIIFHSTKGECKYHEQSISLYNTAEVDILMKYLKELMYFGIDGVPVKETDIGIISPYRRQYCYIQEELNLREWFQIEVGSVETFQGREKRIILVSFVRSNTPTIGFLSNPQRINVTISRPKSLLILIGNAETLSTHAIFSHIIGLCRINGTLHGADAPSKIIDKSCIKYVENLCINDDNDHNKRQQNSALNCIGQYERLNNNGIVDHFNRRRYKFKPNNRTIKSKNNYRNNGNKSMNNGGQTHNRNGSLMKLASVDELFNELPSVPKVTCTSTPHLPSLMLTNKTSNATPVLAATIPSAHCITAAAGVTTGGAVDVAAEGMGMGVRAGAATAAAIPNYLHYDNIKIVQEENCKHLMSSSVSLSAATDKSSSSSYVLDVGASSIHQSSSGDNANVNAYVSSSQHQSNMVGPVVLYYDYINGVCQNLSTESGGPINKSNNNNFLNITSGSTSFIHNRTNTSSSRRYASVNVESPFQVNYTNDKSSASLKQSMIKPFRKSDNCSVA